MRSAFLIFLCLSCSTVCQTSSVVRDVFEKVAPGIASFVKECCEVAPLLAKARLRRSEYYGLKDLHSSQKYESYPKPSTSSYDPRDIFGDEPNHDLELRPSLYDPRDRYPPFRDELYHSLRPKPLVYDSPDRYLPLKDELYHDLRPKTPVYNPRDSYSPFKDEPYHGPRAKTPVYDQPSSYELFPNVGPKSLVHDNLHSCDRCIPDENLYKLLFQLVNDQRYRGGESDSQWAHDILQQVKIDQSDCDHGDRHPVDRSRVRDAHDLRKGQEPNPEQYRLLRQLFTSVKKQTQKDDQKYPFCDSDECDIVCEQEWIKRFWYIVRGQIRDKYMNDLPEEKQACHSLLHDQPKRDQGKAVCHREYQEGKGEVIVCHEESAGPPLNYGEKPSSYEYDQPDFKPFQTKPWDDQPNYDHGKVTCHREYQEGKGEVIICHEEGAGPVVSYEGKSRPYEYDQLKSKPWNDQPNRDQVKAVCHSEYQEGKGEVIVCHEEGTGPDVKYVEKTSSYEYTTPDSKPFQSKPWDDQSNRDQGKVVCHREYKEGEGEVIFCHEDSADPVDTYGEKSSSYEYDQPESRPFHTKPWDDQPNYNQGKVVCHTEHQEGKGEVIVCHEEGADPVDCYGEKSSSYEYDQPESRPFHTKPQDDQPNYNQGKVVCHREYQEGKGEVIVCHEEGADPADTYREKSSSHEDDQPNYKPSRIKPSDDQPIRDQGKAICHSEYQEGKGEVIVCHEEGSGPDVNYVEKISSYEYDQPDSKPFQTKPWDDQPNRDQGEAVCHREYQEGKGEVIICHEEVADLLVNNEEKARPYEYDQRNFEPFRTKTSNDQPKSDQDKAVCHSEYQEGKGEVIVCHEESAGPDLNYGEKPSSYKYDQTNSKPFQAKPWDDQPNRDQGKAVCHREYQEGKAEVILCHEEDEDPVAYYEEKSKPSEYDQPNFEPFRTKPSDDQPKRDQGKAVCHSEYQEGKGEVIVCHEEDAGPLPNYREKQSSYEYDQPNSKPFQAKSWDDQPKYDQGKVVCHKEYQEGKGEVIVCHEEGVVPVAIYEENPSPYENDHANSEPFQTKLWDDQPNHDLGKTVCHREYQEGKGDIIVCREDGADPLLNYGEKPTSHKYDQPNSKPFLAKSWEDQRKYDQSKVVCHKEYQEGKGEIIVCHEEGAGPVASYEEKASPYEYDLGNSEPFQNKPWDDKPNRDQGKAPCHREYQEGKGEVIICHEEDADPVANYKEKSKPFEYDEPNVEPFRTKPREDQPNHDKGKTVCHREYQEGKGEVIICHEEDADPVAKYKEESKPFEYDQPNFEPFRTKPSDDQQIRDQGKAVCHREYQEGKGEVVICHEKDVDPVANYKEKSKPSEYDQPNFEPFRTKPSDDQPKRDQGKAVCHSEYHEGKGEVIVCHEGGADPLPNYMEIPTFYEYDQLTPKPFEVKLWDNQPNYDQGEVVCHSEYHEGKGEVMICHEKGLNPVVNYGDQSSSDAYEQRNFKPSLTEVWDHPPNSELCHNEDYQEGEGDVIFYHDEDVCNRPRCNECNLTECRRCNSPLCDYINNCDLTGCSQCNQPSCNKCHQSGCSQCDARNCDHCNQKVCIECNSPLCGQCGQPSGNRCNLPNPNQCNQPGCSQCNLLNYCNQCNKEICTFGSPSFGCVRGEGCSQCHSSGPGPCYQDNIQLSANAQELPNFCDNDWPPVLPCASDSFADIITGRCDCWNDPVYNRKTDSGRPGLPKRKFYDIRTIVRERY